MSKAMQLKARIKNLVSKFKKTDHISETLQMHRYSRWDML